MLTWIFGTLRAPSAGIPTTSSPAWLVDVNAIASSLLLVVTQIAFKWARIDPVQQDVVGNRLFDALLAYEERRELLQVPM